MMGKLIDTSELLEAIKRETFCSNCNDWLEKGKILCGNCNLENSDMRKIMRIIDCLHGIDAVPVVRCKDCEHYCKHESTKGFCTLHSTFTVNSFTLERMYELEAVSENDYCWKAVRKGR